MRVLITGGYGCIGSWMVKFLLERGDQVWIYDLKQDLRRIRLIVDKGALEKVQYLQGDVTDLPALRQTVERHCITHIVHLAGLQVPVCRADPLLGAKVNVLGTLAILETVRLSQGQV